MVDKKKLKVTVKGSKEFNSVKYQSIKNLFDLRFPDLEWEPCGKDMVEFSCGDLDKRNEVLRELQVKESEVQLDEAEFKLFNFTDITDLRKKTKLQEIQKQFFVISKQMKQKVKSTDITLRLEGFALNLLKAEGAFKQFAK